MLTLIVFLVIILTLLWMYCIEKFTGLDALISSLFYGLIVIGVAFIWFSQDVGTLSSPLKDQMQTFGIGLAIISLCFASANQIRSRYTFAKLLSVKQKNNEIDRIDFQKEESNQIKFVIKKISQTFNIGLINKKKDESPLQIKNISEPNVNIPHPYSSDIALNNPADDRLGYANIAKNVALGINSISEPNGFVVSINAKWGAGKTTFLNFINYYLSNYETDGGIIKNNEKKPIIVRFNPWWFSGKEDLIRQFFAQFGLGLKKELKIIVKITVLFGEYLTAITPVLNRPYKLTMDSIEKSFNPELMDVVSIKQKIIDELPKDRKIVIIVDDIDRLNSDEIKQIFQVIKIIADFPNVVYVLAFDRSVIEPMLEPVQCSSGSKYLEKIIQAPFDLPTPTKLSLYSILCEKLKELMGEYPKERWDKKHWLNVYNGGISELIDTPRQVVRLTNTLKVTYPPIKSEVNPIDFIALEILRLFSPQYYERIQKNSSYFYGFPSQISFYEQEEFKKYHTSLLNKVDDSHREPIEKIIKSIFPVVSSVLDSSATIDTYDAHKVRREMRICCPEFFSRYYWMTVPQDSLSSQEFDRLKGFFNNRESLNIELIRIANENEFGLNKIDLILQRLIDHSPSITKDEAIEIIPAIYNVFDKILEVELQQNKTDGIINSYHKFWLVRLLLSRLEEHERVDLIRQVITSSKLLYSILWDLFSIIQDPQHNECEYIGGGSREGTRALFKPETFEELKKLAVDRIEYLSETGELERSFRLYNLLIVWYEWGNKEKSRLWVKNHLQDDAGLLFILENFTHFRKFPDVKFEYIDFETLIKFVDKSDLNEIIQNHLGTLNQRRDLSMSQQRIVQQLNQMPPLDDPQPL